MTGAPVIPVALWGTEKVWPRSDKVPRVWNVLRPPHITVRVGTPVELTREDEDADIVRIMTRSWACFRRKHANSARQPPRGPVGEVLRS